MNVNYSSIYVVILNWNSAQDTIHCIKSVLNLNKIKDVTIVVCDNDSKKESYEEIKNFVLDQTNISNLIISENEISNYKNLNYKIVLIKNEKNYGYAGGNNRGVRFALNQETMQYVWILNNDTEVAPDSLDYLIDKFESNKKYGVVGSKLVEFENRKKVQGIGGVINPKFCTTKEIGNELAIDENIDELNYEKKIDYVIGASMMFNRLCLQQVGLMCEDYFLYYEEIDICNRIRQNNLKVGIASKSIVYHKHGASTGKGKSDVADYYSVTNRLLLARKFYKENLIFVKISFVIIIINRLKRLEFKRGFKYMFILLNK
ncbi:glycosyltransferase family 2 protein [Acinetobacter soli]|uniref:glycosyltransferase family 2 protein n=1 Tax=Acinetobacter soli TaxID=487316 RepID=UPI003016EC15